MYSNLQYFTNTAYTEMFKMQLRIDVPISRPFIVLPFSVDSRLCRRLVFDFVPCNKKKWFEINPILKIA